MDERELVARCIRGESRSWERFVDEYGGAVLDAARFTLRRVLGAVRDEDAGTAVPRLGRRCRLFTSRSPRRWERA